MRMTMQTGLWIGFGGLITVMFILDLGVFNRESHEITLKEAAAWTVAWVALALAFAAGIYFLMTPEKALEFVTGYIIEESLSVDNLFVFIMIFSYFHVSRKYQPKILKWGIIGALIMRAVFIFAGIGLIERFHWMIYLFGILLVYTGGKMAFGGEGKIEPEKNIVVRWFRKMMPVTSRIRSDRFFIRRGKTLAATPLFVTLLVVESSDVIFAVDSIPAILSITRDPFIVYTSNVFAIMGLRSLYYLLAGALEMFVYLKFGVSVILAYVGAKMLLTDIFEIPIYFSLGIVLGVLIISILFSLRSEEWRNRKRR
jgi:tellurite resistance protein TerC